MIRNANYSDEELIRVAQGNAMIMCYNKSSDLRVGAAIACKPEGEGSGYDIYIGSLVSIGESGPSISAEINAGLKAVGDGRLIFDKIAVYSNEENYKPSKETLLFLKEFAAKDFQILTLDEEDHTIRKSLGDFEGVNV